MQSAVVLKVADVVRQDIQGLQSLSYLGTADSRCPEILQVANEFFFDPGESLGVVHTQDFVHIDRRLERVSELYVHRNWLTGGNWRDLTPSLEYEGSLDSA